VDTPMLRKLPTEASLTLLRSTARRATSPLEATGYVLSDVPVVSLTPRSPSRSQLPAAPAMPLARLPRLLTVSVRMHSLPHSRAALAHGLHAPVDVPSSVSLQHLPVRHQVRHWSHALWRFCRRSQRRLRLALGHLTASPQSLDLDVHQQRGLSDLEPEQR
jgi:hypothetical protein